jgi:2-C-methyl-D-erythritol 4-phosphate cytidylyltransferase
MAGKVVAIIPAAGSGSRMGGTAKQFLPLAGVPMLARACLTLEAVPQVEAVVVACPLGQEDRTRAMLRTHGCVKVTAVVAGGKRRQDSVAAGCRVAKNMGAEWVVRPGPWPRPISLPGCWRRPKNAERPSPPFRALTR